jgi:rhodanese-related sulfurtransferase
MAVINRTAKDIARALADHTIVLVDVREPQEYANERIEGALLFPLSTFDPKALPDSGERKVVFHCGSGVRSARAAEACMAAGIAHDAHLEGGIQAWKAARLPTVRG